MAKSVPARSAGDGMIKASVQRLGLPKKTLKKAVQQATVRLVAERIARERLDSAWQEVMDLAKQQQQAPKVESSKARAG